MNHDLGAVVTLDGDHLEHVACSVRTEVEHLSVVLLGCSERVVDGMQDVGVGDAVLASRSVDVHVTSIVSRNYDTPPVFSGTPTEPEQSGSSARWGQRRTRVSGTTSDTYSPHMNRGLLLLSAVLLVGSTCNEQPTGNLRFGEDDSACMSTVLDNGPDDADRVAAGSGCFLAEVDAGRATTWDLLALTTEGGPIVWRYEFDGNAVTITADHTHDDFGGGPVKVEQCASVESSAHVPVGVDCVAAAGPGFDSDGLP